MLKKSLALAAALTLATLSAQAQSTSQQVEVAGPALRSLTETEYDNVKGRYQMSDGRQLRVQRRGLRVIAELEGLEPVVLRAAGSDHLMSSDGFMQLHVSGDELVSHVRLVIDRRLAQNGAAGGTVGTWTLTSALPKS